MDLFWVVVPLGGGCDGELAWKCAFGGGFGAGFSTAEAGLSGAFSCGCSEFGMLSNSTSAIDLLINSRVFRLLYSSKWERKRGLFLCAEAPLLCCARSIGDRCTIGWLQDAARCCPVLAGIKNKQRCMVACARALYKQRLARRQVRIKISNAAYLLRNGVTSAFSFPNLTHSAAILSVQQIDRTLCAHRNRTLCVKRITHSSGYGCHSSEGLELKKTLK